MAVNGDHSLRVRRQRGSDRVGGEVHRPRIDVAEDRVGADRQNGLGAGVEGERRHDHVVAGLHADGAQGDHQRVGSVADADGVFGAHMRREFPLELLHLGTEDEAAAVEHARDRGVEFGAQWLQLGGGVEERDRHARNWSVK